MKTTYLFLLLTMLTGYCYAQTSTEKLSKEERNQLSNELPKLDRSAGQFNPAFFNDTKNSHQAVIVQVDNGVYTLVKRVERPGKLPFLQEQDAPFVISYLSKDGKQLGGYSIATPASVRSCESQRVGARSPVGKFTFELLIPNDPAIEQLALSDNKKRIVTLSLPRATKPPKK